MSYDRCHSMQLSDNISRRKQNVRIFLCMRKRLRQHIQTISLMTQFLGFIFSEIYISFAHFPLLYSQFIFSAPFTAILQRNTVNVGQIRLVSIATCLYLCMDECGNLYSTVSGLYLLAFMSSTEIHHIPFRQLHRRQHLKLLFSFHSWARHIVFVVMSIFVNIKMFIAGANWLV